MQGKAKRIVMNRVNVNRNYQLIPYFKQKTV